MRINITYIKVEFADVSTAAKDDFLILHYLVDWEYVQPVTDHTLTGTIKTQQITDTQKVYDEIREFINNLLYDRAGITQTKEKSRRSKN